VRWSSLHRLVYRDPVPHTMLGVMQNWLEGVLQYHVRWRWGIGIASLALSLSSKNPDYITPPPSPLEQQAPVLDMEILDKELNALLDESKAYKASPAHIKHLRSEASIAGLW
jgi:hypothetical protein